MEPFFRSRDARRMWIHNNRLVQWNQHACRSTHTIHHKIVAIRIRPEYNYGPILGASSLLLTLTLVTRATRWLVGTHTSVFIQMSTFVRCFVRVGSIEVNQGAHTKRIVNRINKPVPTEYTFSVARSNVTSIAENVVRRSIVHSEIRLLVSFAPIERSEWKYSCGTGIAVPMCVCVFSILCHSSSHVVVSLIVTANIGDYLETHVSWYAVRIPSGWSK